MTTLNVEILHIADCANWQEAGRRLRAALDATGHHTTPVKFRLLNSPTEAESVPFAGSPTILINGSDAVPDASPITELACRIYRTSAGFAGAPTIEELTQAITERI
ncbi:MAG TPA: hypothetical protein VN108_03615 [Marmoricola sp.]|nr:hypothetical protein [Marmoricola sp.]